MMNKKQRVMLARIVAAALLLIALHFVPEGALDVRWRGAAYLVPYLIVGHDILRKAARGIYNRQVCDENFLMSIATIGAFALAIHDDGDFLEAVAVMLFYQVGEFFQSAAVGRSRRSISALMDIRPDIAHVERDGAVETVDPYEVEIGSVIVVKPGERVPIDGVVISGSSMLDTRALTGESVPRAMSEGSEVLSGCVSVDGVLHVRTSKEFGESTASKILDLVENASSRKSRSEDLISRFARVYTPAVCICALALAIVPPIVRAMLIGVAPEWGSWMYRALTFLVISCPCALVISVPLTFFAGLGGASSQGVLVKGSSYLESLSRARCAVFDKTGTLTQGEFKVREVVAHTLDRSRLIELAAHAEAASNHPIARSIVDEYGSAPDESRVANVREEGGMGVVAEIDGATVAVGNARLMEKVGAVCADDADGTVVHIAVDGEYAGMISISDAPKETARDAVTALRREGVDRVVMLTGDSRAAAEKIARELDIDEFVAELLPGGKVDEAERLIKETRGVGTLVFVGDGINDAPVLARADVGVAMGAIGSDAAIEAADVVLMDDDPLSVARAIRIARRTLRIVRQNVIFATGAKFLCLAAGAVGLGSMWIAVFADVGVMVIAVSNAVRAMFTYRDDVIESRRG